ncbi:MAG: formate C-acetyltransferase [Firmicutes bacterium GWF2_51_9]|nr:MAG: formate C-acetyltransferase [Firmicutes bacterium GWF2_51_9]OGS58596.1 MAG: formate C-acetyltransferase [Firmicutes bacterium GWE2_51_13]HAM62479.1 formate C-acetyltransferase [Erysipelotrichaceae bacterium]
MSKPWEGFIEGNWQNDVDVDDFIQKNFTLYEGDDSFLAPISANTEKVWARCEELLTEERRLGVLDIDTDEISGIANFKPGYILKDYESIVGLQSDAPLKRIINPYGGIKLAASIVKHYGREMKPEYDRIFNEYTKTHNQGVFDAYTKEMRKVRHTGLLTGLPDAYGRGRIIGDYRRVALYGIDYLIKMKEADKEAILDITEDTIRLREEVSDQIKALKAIKAMAASYGFDISRPAETAQEAVQWLYFAYLAAVKENNGAAMSLGRTSTFLDIYIQRDLDKNLIDETLAQEYIDQFIIKLRLVRHLRSPEYDELFAGDPTWVTESIGGVSSAGIPLVTKNSFRYLHSLTNISPAPEPNMTVLWSQRLPENFKKYCAKMSIETGAIQYENDDLMEPLYQGDYAIACCVSAMSVGKQTQYFGARTNLAKALLYSLNGGRDENYKELVIAGIPQYEGEVLDYDKVMELYLLTLEKTAKLYVDTMNIIHFMHDKYAYEKSQFALHDTWITRLMAFGAAGLSVVADSLSAIKYAKVTPIRDEHGIAVDFKIEGDFPKFGNDDDRVDQIAVDIISKFSGMLKQHPLYRDAVHTLSILTITSNVVYGKKTGSTPDGRKAGEPFAPGANPMHGRDNSGALASLNSVAKLPYEEICQDGVSNTFTILPSTLGKTAEERISNCVSILDGYFKLKAHHLNVNVYSRETLMAAMENPQLYPNLTIRVSGYAVRFNRLTKDQQLEVLERTFHDQV